VVAVIILSTSLVSAQSMQTGFLDRTAVVGGVEFGYQVFVPRSYTASYSWPVILSLHGSGEKGTDGLFQTEIGLGSAIRRDAQSYPAIVVFPQTRNIWQDEGAEVALAALDSTLAEFSTDSDRVYLTGLSMGGNGSWYLAYHHGDRFAAAAIVCGWVQGYREDYYPPIGSSSSVDRYSDVAQRVKDIPVWIFHGDADQTVDVEESRRMNTALQIAGADVRYSEFEGVGHNAWDPAYAYSAFVTWLFEQRKGR
ncbi:MAG: prolyl oligopeptidase family serine peptidase, partial [Rhodothermales bacterium]|nr:prolyl oligopeptidase family serine peptidase [Rhodothermales bacterium]